MPRSDTEPGSPAATLPGWQRPLVVVAHPDDESFGLGAVLAEFVAAGARPAVLCFTHGEASTLHGIEGDLRDIRAGELAEAARLLALEGVTLLDEPDGGLAAADRARLVAAAVDEAVSRGSDGLLAFDRDGVTGHPDHVAATEVAVATGERLGLGVLGWTLPTSVTGQLNEEFGAGFGGREPAAVDIVLRVRREAQLAAVQAHPSQAVPTSVLWRRLELLGEQEHLCWLRPEPVHGADTAG